MIGQGDAPQIMQSFDLVTPPGSPVIGVVHIEDIKIGTRREIHIAVTTNDSAGELWFDGKTMRFGDGYTIVQEKLANAPGLQVLRLTGTTPNGESESAMIVSNFKTGKASSHGMERFSKLMAKSADVELAGVVLPLVTAVPGRTSRLAPMGGAGCVGAVLTLAAVTAGTVGSCMTGNVMGCGAGVVGTGVAA
ncbi:MAG TPA: hypothetical protein VG323_19070, partial [Thermoanaerobaculia bacterium]|nr:hypothetical protein [Thermoanaerobaculia bacterium]